MKKEDLEMCQMDLKTAFLNGELKEEVFMEIPKGVDYQEDTRLDSLQIEEVSIWFKSQPLLIFIFFIFIILNVIFNNIESLI